MDGALVTTWTSSGTTDDPESIALTGTSGSVIDVTGVLSDDEWLSIIEVSFLLNQPALLWLCHVRASGGRPLHVGRFLCSMSYHIPYHIVSYRFLACC